MKRIILLLITLFLLTACTENIQNQALEEVISEEAEKVFEEQEKEEVLEENNYKLFQNQAQVIHGVHIELTKMYGSGKIDLLINGEKKYFELSKSPEIFSDLRMSVQNREYSGSHDESNYVLLKIEELNLESDEYLVRKLQKTKAGTKDLTLTDSRRDGSIRIRVSDIGKLTGAEEIVEKGETIEIYGMEITNLENYYKQSLYAVVKATPIN